MHVSSAVVKAIPRPLRVSLNSQSLPKGVSAVYGLAGNAAAVGP